MEHDIRIETDLSARYPFKAVCDTCTWQSWGYVARFAAELMADDHQAQVTGGAA